MREGQHARRVDCKYVLCITSPSLERACTLVLARTAERNTHRQRTHRQTGNMHGTGFLGYQTYIQTQQSPEPHHCKGVPSTGWIQMSNKLPHVAFVHPLLSDISPWRFCHYHSTRFRALIVQKQSANPSMLASNQFGVLGCSLKQRLEQGNIVKRSLDENKPPRRNLKYSRIRLCSRDDCHYVLWKQSTPTH